jgi:glycerophosphoryl diester phosphodiesterase
VSEQPLIITHRGDLQHGIENTIPAVASALLTGATGIEIDVRQTASGEVVVFHDFSLRRMFERPGYIGKTPYSDLSKIPYKSASDQANYYIDTLDAFLERFGSTVPINLDAKTIHFFDFKFADKLDGILRNHKLIDSVWISCFNPFLLQILKLQNRNIRTGYLFQRVPWLHTSYDLITYTDAWHPNHRILNEKLVSKAQRNAKELYVWTVNEEEVIRRVLTFPIDGIITDDVKLVKKVIEEQN